MSLNQKRVYEFLLDLNSKLGPILPSFSDTGAFLRQKPFLADRNNGRAYATVLRLSSSSVVVVCNVMYCG